MANLESMGRQVAAPVQPKDPTSPESVLEARRAGQPSSADLDAVEHEKQIAAATAGAEQIAGNTSSLPDAYFRDTVLYPNTRDIPQPREPFKRHIEGIGYVNI